MATETLTTTWDVRVVAFDDATNILSYVPRWETVEFSEQLNGVGSGKITHDLSDPWFAEFELEHGEPLLTGPFSLQIVRNNNPVFTFLIQDADASRVGTNQPVTISGPGIAAALEWAVVIPEDFSGQTLIGSITSGKPKFFDRLFPGYYHDARVATTAPLSSCVYAAGYAAALPGVGATLTKGTFGKINDENIDGLSTLFVGDRILVKNQANSAHNGIYWISDSGSSSSPWVLRRHARCDGSPIADLEVGNNCWVQQGQTQGYTAWTISNNSGFNDPTQVGSKNLTWSKNTTGTYTGIAAFWLLFQEAITGYELYTSQSIFGNVNTSAGRGGVDFAVTWPLFIDPVIDAVNGAVDSNGMVVQDGGAFNIPAGKNMLEVLGQITAQTATTWYVGPTGEIKIATTPFVGDNAYYDTPIGTDRTSGSAAKLFTLPMMSDADTKTQSGGRRTVVYGTNGLNLDRMISPQSAYYGIRESYFENSSSDTSTSVANITTSAMRKVDGGKLQVTAKINESYGYQAWIDFAVGDKVLVENTVGNYVEQIISAISSSISSSGETTIEVTFGEVFADVATDLYAAAGFGSTSASELSVFSGQPSKDFLTAPTSTSVVAKTTGLSNRAIIKWETSESLKTASYDVTVIKKEQTYNSGSAQWVQVVREATGLERKNGVVTATTSVPHGYVLGNIVDISDTAIGFGGTGIPIISVPTSTTFLYNNNGPDDSVVSINPYLALISRIDELVTVNVPATETVASIENLSTPGATYSYYVSPVNNDGLVGEPSTVNTFTASTEPYELIGTNLQSSNWVSATTGWRIKSDGTAEFNGGAFAVTSIDIGGNDASSFHVDTSGNMWLGASASASAPFRVTSAGVLTATSGTFGGSLVGGTIDIGGNDASSFHVDSSGNMWVGASTYAAAPFKVSAAGALEASSAKLGPDWNVVGNNLQAGGSFVGVMRLGPTASSLNTPAFYISGEDDAEAYVSSEFMEVNNGIVQTMQSATSFYVSNGSGVYSSLEMNQLVVGGDIYGYRAHVEEIGEAGVVLRLRGAGISYADATFGPGTNNAMALQWTGSQAFVVIDNVAGQYLGGGVFSDRRIKTNIAEPSDEWTNKLLNEIKIWQFDKINPLDEDDMHVYSGHIGVIADEFKEIFPQFESSSLLADPDGADADKIRSVDLSFMTPTLVLIAQKFDARLKEIEARLGI
jgi:hypothetical protein